MRFTLYLVLLALAVVCRDATCVGSPPDSKKMEVKKALTRLRVAISRFLRNKPIMIRNLAIFALIATSAFIEASPRMRRDDRIERYCLRHQDHYAKYCQDASRVDRAMYGKLAKFCPAYEKHCAISKGDFIDTDEDDSLVVPPPLPRGGDFAALDLPIGREVSSAPKATVSNQRLTAAIIASCTPECTAPQCTDECKCAHTHPKVHAMCNPPANAQLAATCQKWYTKCPMFQPVAYY